MVLILPTTNPGGIRSSPVVTKGSSGFREADWGRSVTTRVLLADLRTPAALLRVVTLRVKSGSVMSLTLAV